MKKRLGDIADVISGFAFKSSWLGEQGIPVIKIGNILDDGSIDLEKCQYLPDSFWDSKYSKYLLRPGDILIAMTGATCGKVGRFNTEGKYVLNQRVAVIRGREVSQDILGVVLSQKIYREKLYNLGRGAAQPNISGKQIEDIEVLFPGIDDIPKIEQTVSDLNNLIEINKKQIALLEESARLIYREWFVHLRFPGYEKVKVLNGVPDGWSLKRLVDVADVLMGQSPPSEMYNDIGEGLPFHQGVTGFKNRFIKHEYYTTALNRIAHPKDILFSVRAPVGRINLTEEKIVIGRGLASIRSKMNNQNFLFYQLKNKFFKLDMFGSGTIYASTTKDELHGQKLLTPTDGLIEKFEEIIIPIDDLISNLTKQNDSLEAGRDLLLPRLINGEVEL